MAPYTQPITEKATPLQGRPELTTDVLEGYRSRMQPINKEIGRATQANLASIGGGQAGDMGQLATLGLGQSVAANEADYASELGLRAADISEADRVRELIRSWQVSDRDQRYADARTAADANTSNPNAQLWSNIMKSVGTVGGMTLGGPLGGKIGGALGGAFGNKVGGG